MGIKAEFDLLVYLALVLVVVVIGIAAWVLVKTPDATDPEARKLRFAAATFTGITMLFVFAASLYVAGGEDGPGREIFDKGLTAMFTLAGSIVGYLFGSAKNAPGSKSATTPP
jgi:cytochrome bd-type quinol oxidase subunit 2